MSARAATMRCVLLGPAEHVSDAERAAFARDLAGLDLEVDDLPLGAVPRADAAILIVNSKTLVDAAALARLPQLRLLVTTTSGHDHVDLAAAAARGVVVARCPEARRDAVVDTALGLGLALLRRVPRMHRATAEGSWTRGEVKDLALPRVAETTVAVIGHGVIGARVAEAWRALGARVVAVDPADPALPPLHEALAEAGLVTLHCSLSASSRRLIRAETLALLPPGAVLVNTARGECVDEEDLLADRRLGGAGLDVFEREPGPNLRRLAALDNVLLTPHSAGAHRGLAAALHDEARRAVAAWIGGGRPPHTLS